ncbi:replication protein RepA [Escherichia coli]|uniref:replication protein RepA n=1 Tax=Escherichia coli TaxID=562 RepID=UPI00339534B0
MAELLAIRFLDGPGNLFVLAKVEEDYRGFCFSGSYKSTSEPVPCHLMAWPATKFLKRSAIYHAHRKQARM